MILVKTVTGRKALVDDSGRARLLTTESFEALEFLVIESESGMPVHDVEDALLDQLLKDAQTRMGASYG